MVLLLNSNIVLSIIQEWQSNGPYSHGSLGFLVFLAAIWQRKVSLSAMSVKPSHWGGVFLCASLCLLFVANIASVQQLQQLSLFMVIVSCVIFLLGSGHFKLLFLPFVILLLNLPVWNLLQQPLRVISTEISYVGSNLMGTSIERDGFLFRTIGGNFEVEPACSGLGFFLVSALLAACLSCFERLQLKQTLKFLCVALTVALIANWVRIIAIVVVGSETQMQHFIVDDHLTFGWLVFLVFLIPLILYSRHFMAQKNIDSNPSTNENPNKIKHAIFNSTISMSLVVITTLSYQWLTSRYDANYQYSLPNLNSYELVSQNKTMSPNWQPYSSGVSSEQFHYFIDGSTGLQVYVANYTHQYQAKEMIYVENSLFNKRLWREINESELNLPDVAALDKSKLIELKSNGKSYRLITYWYAIAGGYTASKKQAKLDEIKATLSGKPEASIIAVAIDYNIENRDDALAALTKFTAEFVDSSAFLTKLD